MVNISMRGSARAACTATTSTASCCGSAPSAAWRRSTHGTPYVPSPLLIGDRLYFTYLNNPVLTCLDTKTGEPVIDRERLPELSSLYASPAGAKDRLYLVDRDGTTLVIKRSDKLEV